MAKNPQLTEKNPAELIDMLREKREELRTLRFSGVGARTKNTSGRAGARKDIARIMTELGRRTRETTNA